MLKQLREGQYFGVINHQSSFNGINITDTEYTHEYVDWHCHENPYFTFLLQGKLSFQSIAIQTPSKILLRYPGKRN